MVKKTDEENHFSWCCFLSHSPLLFFLVTLITFLVFLYLLSSYGFSSLLVTIAILFISTSLFFLRFFKKRTGVFWLKDLKKKGITMMIMLVMMMMLMMNMGMKTMMVLLRFFL
ncbi:unnamed protein product [Brassica napus]|uniref:(rape) hypothetical protein n=1 Tax=Brassica napus TaxID=3708 RepID=A0A816JZ22_BRANA|nr:unnamed protein product [Brassica napus]